jgi:hypothetical protein
VGPLALGEWFVLMEADEAARLAALSFDQGRRFFSVMARIGREFRAEAGRPATAELEDTSGAVVGILPYRDAGAA